MPHPCTLPLLRLAQAAALATWLTGCASVAPPAIQPSVGTSQPQDRPPSSAAVAVPSTPPAAEPFAVSTPAETSAPLPATTAETAPSQIAPPPVSGNRAVIALVDRARQEAGAGRRESAAASLERALRIEPRNAWLWHELARLRLIQGQYAQAVSLAQKSNSLAVRERNLQALNWHLIADARIAQGNPTAAAQARQTAEELQRP